MIRTIAAALLAMGMASAPVAAQTLVSGRVLRIHTHQTVNSGVVINLVEAMSNPDNCPRTDWYILPDDASHAALVQSMLITAQASDRKVELWLSGCYLDFPKIVHFALVRNGS